MKKYVILLFAVVLTTLAFTGCDDPDVNPGGTSVQNMAGQWDVTVNEIDNNGKVISVDPDKLGTITMTTYNTASNSDKEMWLDDNKNFYNFKFKVDVNYTARTFSATQRLYCPADTTNNGTAIVTNGKILKNAAKNLHGAPNDSIVFDIKFSDDTPGLVYRVSGQRYTGFTE
jgi:hypothetical protein